MIKPDAKLSICTLPLSHVQICEYQERFPERLTHYIKLLKEHPGEYAGLLFVKPSSTHPGMFELLDGHHRLCASILTGRPDVMCVVVEEPSREHERDMVEK